MHIIYITHSKQGINSDLEGPGKKSRGPRKSHEGPGNFIVPPPFNFYFNPWLGVVELPPSLILS